MSKRPEVSIAKLPPDLHQELKKVADSKRISMAAALRQAVAIYCMTDGGDEYIPPRGLHASVLEAMAAIVEDLDFPKGIDNSPAGLRDYIAAQLRRMARAEAEDAKLHGATSSPGQGSKSP